MREEVISSGTADVVALARSSSPPPTPAASISEMKCSYLLLKHIATSYSSVGASSPAAPTNATSIDWLGSVQGSKVGSISRVGPQLPRTSMSTSASGSALGTSEPSCRPWERGDLLRRLATFRPSNWSAKPKGSSSLSCARRGWINVDTDVIECESCGAQLTFTVLASWTSTEVDQAVETFAEQLDAGHKDSCSWRGNCCADSLVQFPPMLPSAIIGGYKDRCDGLLQFPFLPVVASSAIETMRLTRSSKIDHMLAQPSGFFSGELGCKDDNNTSRKVSRDYSSCGHLHAQKLISLCGWEPRWLPNIQDCEENSAESAKNAHSVHRAEDEYDRADFRVLSKNALIASKNQEKGKGKASIEEPKYNTRSPLLDCSLCGATVRICDFCTVPRSARFGANNTDNPDVGKKLTLTRGVSAASGINGWVAADAMGKEHIEERDEAAIADDDKSQSVVGVDLNLTIAAGLPSHNNDLPVMPERFDDGGMGRDLIIGQPTGSEVGDRAASYESCGPSSRKCSLEDGGSTVDRPQDRILHADSIEGTVIDRDGDEVDDDTQYSGGPNKRARGFDIFDTYHPLSRMGSSGAGPSRNLCFDIVDANRVESKEESDMGVGFPSHRDSARASSVIAMDVICSGEEDSMESVENYPGDVADIQFPSPTMHRNLDMNDALDSGNQIQQNAYIQHAAASVAREVGGSSTVEGEEIVNAETVTAYARDRISLGISAGSVGMGASHEAEIHGTDISVHRPESIVGDAEPIAEVTENLGQTGESTPGPALVDDSLRQPVIREDPHGYSQEMMSQSVGRADSGSKVYGSLKADSVESGEKVSHTLGPENSAHPSLSCNAMIYSAYEVSKEEVNQRGNVPITDEYGLMMSGNIPGNRIGTSNGENGYYVENEEFDPLKHHNCYCPWVNGNVAAAGCSSDTGSASNNSEVACGWELTLDAVDTFQSLGHLPNQMMQSESAASLNKDDHVTPNQKLLTHHSANKRQGKH
ncbi:uncharacterized protein LOC122001324 isoform X1 [Zingiber officinale]|uniref:uncharacterized protein LOC122001324 isoform X1 n=2 Tax=Zingiber officinale TaxID=94328 RepID=UPI001C4D51AC|nr:uncharacterized protein LOC122001324 isoform X1 [Zingiber officinale]